MSRAELFGKCFKLESLFGGALYGTGRRGQMGQIVEWMGRVGRGGKRG